MKALIMSTDDFEDTELLVPLYRFLENGIETDVAAPEKNTITGKHGYAVDVTITLDQVMPDEYDILVLPGGKAPAALRKEPRALEIVKAFWSANKPVSAICHGPQLLVSAGVLSGRRATCAGSVASELRESGAFYEDAEVVVDGNLVTSRRPSDLPAFMRETMRSITMLLPGRKAA
ncbi:MAG TPA: type 1 glutamine amidotransferase domain-containing protein [Nitrospirota bacterium]|nr:type 1 glutamine amidotransferase domain-containing protein [Nitrospirota bacterium]